LNYFSIDLSTNTQINMQPFSYRDRKYRATTQTMSITYFKLQSNQIDFRVGVIGARKIPYILDFSQSTMNIACTCPDYEKREHKPLCKHMLFIVNLSNQRNMFNNLNKHDDLKDAAKLTQIRESIMTVIDQKKLSAELQESNTVSIERDDFCSICMCDLDEGKIEKCSVCAHVMHIPCIISWWDLTTRWNSLKGKCPYCKDPRGFAHIKQIDEDPWKNFDFHGTPASDDQQVPEPLSPAQEAADQPLSDVLSPAQEEANQPISDVIIGNPPFGIEIINQLRQTLAFINRFRNLNVNNPHIQNLDSRLESLQQENAAIQNAFQAQPE
jgi:hypothetical protein